MLDWLTTLGVADQSLESQLARRDLSKKAQLVQNLYGMQEKQRTDDEELGLKRQALEEQRLIKQATLDQTKAYRDVLERDRQDTEGRNRANMVNDNLQQGAQRGETQVVDQPTAELLQKYMGPGIISTRDKAGGGEAPQEGSGEGSGQLEYLYRQHEAEQAAMAAKQAQEVKAAKELRDQEEEKRKQHDDALRDKADKRAENADARAAQAATRAQQTFERRQQLLDKQLNELPVTVRMAAHQAAQKITKDLSQGFFEDDATYQERVQTAIKKVYDDYAAKAGKPNTPNVTGRGTGPGAGAGGAGGGGAETPEQRYQRLLKASQQPPG